jgi:hypothetical protein
MRRILVLLTVMAAAVLLVSGVALAAKPLKAGRITINDSLTPPTTATPYPSQIVVSGLSGTIEDVNLKLTRFGHRCPDDVDILLVGPTPTEANAFVMSDVGGCGDSQPDSNVRNKTLILDDEATTSLPDTAPISSGTFKPTDSDTSTGTGDIDSFPAPAPTPGATALSVFNGTDPNGTWNLYVVDDAFLDQGQLGGWALEIQTTP